MVKWQVIGMFVLVYIISGVEDNSFNIKKKALQLIFLQKW